MSHGFAFPVDVNTVLLENTTTIEAGENYESDWFYIEPYSNIEVAIKTDKEGYYTLTFDMDSEGTDSPLTRYITPTLIESPHNWTVTRKYAKFTFYNTSGEDQGTFRLQIMVGKYGQLNIPTDAVMSQDYDATAVRPTKYEYEAALGLRQGATPWSKWGANSDVDTGTETVWAAGGSFARVTSAAVAVLVSSDSQDDGDSTDIGAWTVGIWGIDANRQAQYVEVTMNGTSNVSTTETWLGINRLKVLTAGSNKKNVGVITLTIGGSTQATIPAGKTFTQQPLFHTQAGHKFLSDWAFINITKPSGGSSAVVTIAAIVIDCVTGVEGVVFEKTDKTNATVDIQLTPSQAFTVPEKSILEWRCTTDTNNIICNVRFSGIEFRDFNA